MRIHPYGVIAWLAAGAIAGHGCASHGSTGMQWPTGAAAALVHEWDAVRHLAPGARVLVDVASNGIVDGKVTSVSDVDLRLNHASGPVTLARESVTRVVRVESMSRIHAKQGLVAGLLIGGVTLSLSQGRFWYPLAIDPPLLAGAGAAWGIDEQRQTLVYERR